jgi:hypothetical protein
MSSKLGTLEPWNLKPPILPNSRNYPAIPELAVQERSILLPSCNPSATLHPVASIPPQKLTPASIKFSQANKTFIQIIRTKTLLFPGPQIFFVAHRNPRSPSQSQIGRERSADLKIEICVNRERAETGELTNSKKKKIARQF